MTPLVSRRSSDLVQAFLFAEAEVLPYEFGLQERLSPTHGHSTLADEGTVTDGFIEQFLGFPFKLHRSLRCPCIWIMTECTAHGTSLHECHKPDAGTIHSTKRLDRMYSAFHLPICLKRHQTGLQGIPDENSRSTSLLS